MNTISTLQQIIIGIVIFLPFVLVIIGMEIEGKKFDKQDEKIRESARVSNENYKKYLKEIAIRDALKEKQFKEFLVR